MSAGRVALFHFTQGPPAQRINIRWAPNISPAERSRAERQIGLAGGAQLEDARTWSYLLKRRSHENIERLIKDPRIEDTFHIDRAALQVQLDRPDLSPRVRTLLESDRLGEISLVLSLVATGFGWWSRWALVSLIRKLARSFASIFDGASASTHDRVLPGVRELTAAIALGVLFLIPLLIYGPYEDEIVQATILPNQVFYKELFHGRWTYWLNNLGFGAPMPLGDPLMFHPVFAPLAAFTSLRVTLSAVWLFHVVVMVVFFLRLAAAADIRLPWLRLLLVACYVMSAPSLFYFYDTDWIQMAITWTLYPVLVFYLRAAILGEAREHFWRTALWLGLLFGFWVTNAHPGYIVPLSLALAVYIAVAAPLDSRVYLCLGTAAVLCTAIASVRIYTLLREVRLFPVSASAVRGGTTLQSYVAAFIAPLVHFGGRSPFIGVGIGAAAVGSVLGFRRVHDSHLRGCAAAFVASAVFNVIPGDLWSRIRPALGPWQFRDPLLFFGLLAGGCVFQRALQAPQPAHRYAAATLLLLQTAQQMYVLPRSSLAELRGHDGRLLFYRYQGHPFGLGRVLVDQARRFGPRVYLSPEVEKAMRGTLSSDGVHFSSDLVLLGLNPVNGWFKNVSMTVMQPPPLLMESYIRGDRKVIGNPILLDVLGINLELTTERETGVPEGLVVADRPHVHDRALSDLLLLGNSDAWPQAVLMEPDAYTLQLPIHAGCEHEGALCRDYEPLARMRLDGEVALETSNGKYTVRVPRADWERLLFISAMYRPEWNATTAKRQLAVHPVANAFLGITVPPGVTDITIEFTPRTQIVLTWFSNLVFFGTFGGVILIRRQRRDRAIRSMNATVT